MKRIILALVAGVLFLSPVAAEASASTSSDLVQVLRHRIHVKNAVISKLRDENTALRNENEGLRSDLASETFRADQTEAELATTRAQVVNAAHFPAYKATTTGGVEVWRVRFDVCDACQGMSASSEAKPHGPTHYVTAWVYSLAEAQYLASKIGFDDRFVELVPASVVIEHGTASVG